MTDELTTAPVPVAPPMASPTTAKLQEALAKAQGEIEQPEHNKKATIETTKGYTYSYTYTDLPKTFQCARAPLTKNGLSWTQITKIDGSRLVLVTRLMHSSGEWIESHWPLKVSDDPKQTASYLTYGRRYSFSSMCGIAAEETDDDAERKHGGKKEPVRGKLGKSKLQAKMREFDTDLHACSDQDELAGVLHDYEEALIQCERDLPSWYYTQEGSDAPGYEDKIAEAKRTLPEASAGSPAPTAPRKEEVPPPTTAGASGAGTTFLVKALSEIMVLKDDPAIMDWTQANQKAVDNEPATVQGQISAALKSRREQVRPAQTVLSGG